MVGREEAVAALESQDWSGVEVDRDERPATIVVSVRLPADLADVLAGEAERRGVKPSLVLRDLVEGLRPADAEETVTLRRSDLHRAIDQALGSAA